MSQTKPKYISSCCGSEVVVISSGEGTSYYECEECGKPCDGLPMINRDELIELTENPDSVRDRVLASDKDENHIADTVQMVTPTSEGWEEKSLFEKMAKYETEVYAHSEEEVELWRKIHGNRSGLINIADAVAVLRAELEAVIEEIFETWAKYEGEYPEHELNRIKAKYLLGERNANNNKAS